MGLKSAKILFNKPSSQRWDTSDHTFIFNICLAVFNINYRNNIFS